MYPPHVCWGREKEKEARAAAAKDPREGQCPSKRQRAEGCPVLADTATTARARTRRGHPHTSPRQASATVGPPQAPQQHCICPQRSPAHVPHVAPNAPTREIHSRMRAGGGTCSRENSARGPRMRISGAAAKGLPRTSLVGLFAPLAPLAPLRTLTRPARPARPAPPPPPRHPTAASPCTAR